MAAMAASLPLLLTGATQGDLQALGRHGDGDDGGGDALVVDLEKTWDDDGLGDGGPGRICCGTGRLAAARPMSTSAKVAQVVGSDVRRAG